jgi:hypothetical protein
MPFSWPVRSECISAGIMCLHASVVLPESCSELLDFAVCVPSHEGALHKHKFPDIAKTKSYTRNPILRLKKNGKGEQSKIKQVLAKSGKKTISPITTLPRSSEVGAITMNRIGMPNAQLRIPE